MNIAIVKIETSASPVPTLQQQPAMWEDYLDLRSL